MKTGDIYTVDGELHFIIAIAENQMIIKHYEGDETIRKMIPKKTVEKLIKNGAWVKYSR